MPEVIIKYKGAKALKALKDLTKMFDLVIEGPADNGQSIDLPITFAKDPDVTALAGIWQGKDITLEKLRKDAWGDRI